MKQTFPVYLLSIALIFSTSSGHAQLIKKDYSLSYESPILIQQGEVRVTLADFVAHLDWRVPEVEQRDLLASPSRIEGLLESIVLMEAFVHLLEGTNIVDDPHVQARLHQAIAREARSIYRERVLTELELDNYENQARELFMLEPERFQTRETIDFDHILVTESDEIDEVEAMRRALDAFDALATGTSFEEVAERYSADPGFKEHGGKFKDIDIETLVPPVSEVAESLEVNEWSVPVQSRFGWHILRITAVNESDQMSWEEARPVAEEIARERHLNKTYQRRLREINSAPMQFADGAVRAILNHYGLEGFQSPASQAVNEAEND